jgi:purine-binding chemotaxis protein CheW
VGVQALVFRAGAHLAALAVEHVTEVMRPLPVEALAGAPPYVRGICVLRGRPAPVVDLGALLGGDDHTGDSPGDHTGGHRAPGRPDREGRFVGVRTGTGAGTQAVTQTVAVAVDRVVGVRDLPLDGMYDLSSVAGPACSSVGAVGGEPLLLLSAGRVVPDAVWDALGDTA